MPRTKVSKQVAAAKRVRISAMEESLNAALHSLDSHQRAFIEQENIALETNLDLINGLFRAVMHKMPERLKNMTIGEAERLGVDLTDVSNVSSASALANLTAAAFGELSKKNKTSCRSDDGKKTINIHLVFWFIFVFILNNTFWCWVAPSFMNYFFSHSQFN